MTCRFRRVLGVLALCFCAAAAQAHDDHALHSFHRLPLEGKFFAEGATFADINRDGNVDIVAGPYWYAGSEFQERFEIYPPLSFDVNGYSDNFFAFAHDIDGDDWQDVIVIGFPGKAAHWFRNPAGDGGHWQRHLAFDGVDNESPAFADVTGDGKPELVYHSGGRFGFAEIPADDSTRPWTFHAISDDRGYDQFNHGLGVGDVNGDGLADIVEKNGWWEQPGAGPKSGPWQFHRVPFAPAAGGAQMLIYDLDGDGHNDIITSKNAHGYGLAWFKQLGGGDGGDVAFEEHLIMGEAPEENDHGVAFSQLHALALVDIDGDGVDDIVTGKRFWAHREHDPGSLDPAVLYWFQTVREVGGEVRFVPHLIDNDSGVGTQVAVGDANDDSLSDVLVSNKKGTFLFLQQTEPADEATLRATQPRPQQRLIDAGAQKLAKLIGGAAPVDSDERPLNLDCETGDLSDWRAEGAAFAAQPIRGDTVRIRRGDMTSGHADNYWIGTFEIAQDEPQGKLTSVGFEVTHPYATFLIGGGASDATRVEFVREDTNKVVYKASGADNERMHLVTADLRPHLGKQIFIRVVDESSGPWGHVNFDHFRFHEKQPTLEGAATVALPTQPGAKDEYPHSDLSAQVAAQAMQLPQAFSAQVFAAEPDVKQPIAMALDDRGRVWIAEAYEYPNRAPGFKGRDRILIFEDTDGDGRFDNRTVFADNLNLVSGLEVGFGGVWVGAAPYLLFIPDHNGDDVPDGEPQILLDGWGWQDTHETLNTFMWGPDGWLYGCHGVFTHSRVGKPGAPDEERVPLNAAIWRYHPTRHVFEVFAQGTSNPWGIDFNDHGQMMATACVIPHLFHIIQGARYNRQAGEHFNRHTYADIPTIADHLHYLGASPHSGNERSDEAGGGHAHAGAMIYLGGAWPAEYRNQIFMNNIHGQRLNTDVLTPRGSGYVGGHGPDFLLTRDKASQMLNFRYGPDGQVVVIDWYDMQACHDPHADAHDRSNGRIYKIVYGEAKAEQPSVDLSKESDVELAERMLAENDWYVRHARRILQERAAAGTIDAAAIARLRQIATENRDETRRLRALWALHVVHELNDELIATLLGDPNEYVRGWAIQLALDRPGMAADAWLPRFADLARDDPSPVVRLYLASALQQIAPADRWDILAALAAHAEDAHDHNLPLMIWYAAEPLAEADPDRALALGLASGRTIPRIREFMVRRVASIGSQDALAALIDGLAKSADTAEQLAILDGIRQALRGQRQVPPTANWPAAYERAMTSDDQRVRTAATGLGVTFGDPGAMAAFRKMVRSQHADAVTRRAALDSLLGVKDSQLVPILKVLLHDPSLRDLALSGLAQYDDPETATVLLRIYPQLTTSERRTALATLCARPTSGVALLQAVTAGNVSSGDLSADLVRQLQNHQNSAIDTLLAETWGTVRSTPQDKTQLMADMKKLIENSALPTPDPSLGRSVFAKTCGQCHTLYGVGGQIGPDLTGSNRGDLDYLLSNIVDPSAIMAKEYQPTVVITMDGRVLTGIVTKEDENAITLQTATEEIVLPHDEIDERELSEVSMMPDDQLRQFGDHETRSLFAYLKGKSQVPPLATKGNAGELFNGRDLTGWTGDFDLWSVENGEIVGRSPALEHNSFLISDMIADDFDLEFEIKLVEDVGNTGVQFRSYSIHGHDEVEGYQADAGPGWWGKLYEEHGRELMWDKSGEEHIKRGDWNHYHIRATGSHIQTFINGQPCVDLFDPNGKRRGHFALQIHSGPPMEVRFRNLRLQILSDDELSH